MLCTQITNKNFWPRYSQRETATDQTTEIMPVHELVASQDWPAV